MHGCALATCSVHLHSAVPTCACLPCLLCPCSMIAGCEGSSLRAMRCLPALPGTPCSEMRCKRVHLLTQPAAAVHSHTPSRRLAVSTLVSMGSGALGGRTSTSPRKGGAAAAAQGLPLKRRRTASGELPPLAQRPRAGPPPPAAPPAPAVQPQQQPQQPLSEQLAILQKLLGGPAAPLPLPVAAPAATVLPAQLAAQPQQAQQAASETEMLLRLLLQDPAAPAGPTAAVPPALQAQPAVAAAAAAALPAGGAAPSSGTTTDTLMSLLGFLAQGKKGAAAPSPAGQPR